MVSSNLQDAVRARGALVDGTEQVLDQNLGTVQKVVGGRGGGNLGNRQPLGN